MGQLRLDPNPGCLVSLQRVEIWTHRQGKCRVKMKAASWGTHPQVKEPKDYWAATSSLERGRKQAPHSSSQKEPTPPTLWVQTSMAQNCETIYFCCFTPFSLWDFLTEDILWPVLKKGSLFFSKPCSILLPFPSLFGVTFLFTYAYRISHDHSRLAHRWFPCKFCKIPRWNNLFPLSSF